VAQTQYSTDAGATWNVYTAPFTLTTENVEYIVLARSWDNAGNDEGPLSSYRIKIDKTPPTIVETSVPSGVVRIGQGQLIRVDYSATESDSGSGLYNPGGTTLVDSYGVYTQDLGPFIQGYVYVEAWCTSGPRTYTFRYSRGDAAGNPGYGEDVTTILKK
jgi:hypothetical protein